MRLTAAEAYEQYGTNVRAYLNGHDVTGDCTEADEEAGYVIICPRNAEGKHYLNPWTGGLEKVRREGSVRIEIAQPAPNTEP